MAHEIFSYIHHYRLELLLAISVVICSIPYFSKTIFIPTNCYPVRYYYLIASLVKKSL